MRKLGIATVVIALAVAASVPFADAKPKTRTVFVKDNFFSPKTRTVRKGDSVRFDWSKAGTDHNVKFTSVPKGAHKPRSCGDRASGACKRKLAKKGTYRYVCTIHLQSDGMRGKIVAK